MSSEIRNRVARDATVFAVFWGVLGSFISFYPGAEVKWFSIGALAAALGMASTSWRLRVFAFFLLLGMLLMVWDGYFRGVQYQEWLKTVHLPRP